MRQFILEEAPDDREKMRLFNLAARHEKLDSYAIDELLRYYKICLAYKYHRARMLIEAELCKRDLPELCVPLDFLTNPDTTDLTIELAQFVVDAKGKPDSILRMALEKPYNCSRTIISAYLLAIALGENELEVALRSAINTFGTYTSYINNFLKICSKDKRIVSRLSELKSDMEVYKSW